MSQSVGVHNAIPEREDGVVRVSPAGLIALRRGGETLPLKANSARAHYSGGYLSPFKGRGMEFDEVRPYTVGDDVRTLDWRVTARTGRPHTKLFREERERPVLLWLDLRRPMMFATRGAFKAVRAAQAAALLGWSAVSGGDRVGALLFDERQHLELRPRHGSRALLNLFGRLSHHEAWSAPHLGSPVQQEVLSESMESALARLRRVAQPGSLIFLLSDFNGLQEQDSRQLYQLSRHNEVVLINIHDPLEASLPPQGRYQISDGVNEFDLDSSDRRFRDDYRQRYEQHTQWLTRICRRYRLHHIELSTADEPLPVLRSALGGVV